METRNSIEIVIQSAVAPILVKDCNSPSERVHAFDSAADAHLALGYLLGVDVVKEAAILVSKHRGEPKVIEIIGPYDAPCPAALNT